VVVVPGGVAMRQTSPRRLSVLLDWLRRFRCAMAAATSGCSSWRSLPAASRGGPCRGGATLLNVALSGAHLLGTGVGASIIHLPVLSALGRRPTAW
jgi:hypothetical protein